MATLPGMSYAPSWYKPAAPAKKPFDFKSLFTPKPNPATPLGPPSSVPTGVLKPGAKQWQPNAAKPGGGTWLTGPTAGPYKGKSPNGKTGGVSPQQRRGTSGGGSSSAPIYSSGGAVGTDATGAAAPVQPMSDEDWWNQDQDFQVEGAGLKNVMDTALASLAAKRANFDTDFVGTLKNLGWDWEGDDASSLDNVAGGKWDPTNKLGAYGQGWDGLQNDFAGRGLMDSSFFDTAQTNFNTDFNNQFKGLTTQRGQFLDENGDNTGAGLAARNEYQNALARARQSSLGRRDVGL